MLYALRKLFEWDLTWRSKEEVTILIDSFREKVTEIHVCEYDVTEQRAREIDACFKPFLNPLEIPRAILVRH